MPFFIEKNVTFFLIHQFTYFNAEENARFFHSFLNIGIPILQLAGCRLAGCRLAGLG